MCKKSPQLIRIERNLLDLLGNRKLSSLWTLDCHCKSPFSDFSVIVRYAKSIDAHTSS